MIISLAMGIVLAIVTGIIAAAVFYYLLKTLKINQKWSLGIGVTLGLLAGVFLFMSAGRIVVVKGMDDAGSYLVYGAPTYEFTNGYKLKLTMESLEGYVLNDCDLELVLEKVIYSTGYVVNEDYDILIRPMSITKMPGISVDYYFGDIPPDEIELSQGGDSETRWWLRSRDSYEDEYGISVYDTQVKSISAQPHNTASEN
jgi:hypothetical protein